VLNRIYIVVGILAIVVLAGAFIAPRFIQWSDYRERMEALASGVLGARVIIHGDIEFSLLPQPRLRFTDVVVGREEAPAATVAGVEAEFALMDFLRDNYSITALVLREPVVNLTVDENGLFGSDVEIAGAGGGVALGHARIVDGSVLLADRRSGESYAATDLDGDLRLSSFAGPFQFQGAASYGGRRYDLRFNTGTLDATGNNRITGFLREAGGAYSTAIEGLMTAGLAPRFEGTLVYRQAPPGAERADDIRGDLLFEGAVSATTDRGVVSGYTLHPDENRAGMRLTGAASIQLGARRSFDAVVSGGVFSLPPRDAAEVPSELPYELVRLFSELPAPPLPPIPGRIGIDLAEVGLRGFSLRDLRLDATTDGTDWRIEQAVAEMPGDTELRLSGTVTGAGGRIGFRGDLAVTSQRLDALSQLWRRPREDNPLFNMPGGLEGRVMLAGDALGLSNARLTLGRQVHGVELRIGFGDEPRLDVVGHFDDLDPMHSAALQALLPDIAAEPSFGVSFPDGSFSVTAQTVDLMGLVATDLVAEGQWSPTALRLSRFAAGDWGGLSFGSSLRLSGSLGEPRLTGSGQLAGASADAEGLDVLYELAGVPFGWQQGLAGSWPADLQFILTDADGGSGQVLTLGGRLGAGELDFRAEMAEGLTRLAGADLRLVASLEGEDGPALAGQLGLGPVALFSGAEPLLASLFFEGNPATGFDGRVSLGSGGESIGYFGGVDLADTGELHGAGTLELRMDDASGLAALAGARGAGLGAVEASAAMRFEGSRILALTGIAGVAGEAGFGGSVSMQRVGQLPTFEGSITVDALDVEGLAAALFGPAALVGAEPGAWPEGPLAVTGEPRPSRGSIVLDAEALRLGGEAIGGATALAFAWNPQSVGLERFATEIGGGRLALDIGQCCAGALDERTLSGRVTVTDVDLEAVLPPALSAALSGRLGGGLQFEGTGASLADAMRAMTGEGNFSVAGFRAAGLSAGVYPSVAGLDDVLDMEADTLETLIGLALGQGAFEAEEARGAFTIAGGTARLANLIVEGRGGRLAGSLDLALARLGLNGSFVMTPLGFADAGGLIEPDTARIVARIAGTLLQPQVTFDLSEMVAAVQVRANELEVERLEILRLEDEARQRAAAEERNRLIEEQRRQAAEEAARRAAEEAARQAAEDAARQQQAPDAGTAPSPDQPVSQPLNLGFQPGVNQPFGNPVNQPLDLLPGR